MQKLSKGLAIISVLVLTGMAINGINSHNQAPDLVFPLLDGRELALSSLAGRPVLITFWASTCIECRQEIPLLVTLYNELSPSGFEVIAVAMPYDPPNRVLEASQYHNVPYAVALDIHGKAVQAFGDVAVTPSAFLIAPDGNIVDSYIGRIDVDRLRGQVLTLLDDRPVASQLQSCGSLVIATGDLQRGYICPG